MFKLGNFSVVEILYAVAQNFSDEILYSIDQLQSASIEISSEPTEITDKNGNIVRTIYNSKTGTFTSTAAMLSPAILNAASGSEIEIATEFNPIDMPKIVVVNAGQTVKIDAVVEDTVHVIGLYKNGANGDRFTQGVEASLLDKTFKFVDGMLTVPAAVDEDSPSQYLVRCERTVVSGMKLSNLADKFPATVRLTLLCSIMDPCDDQLKAAYIFIPSFSPDPSVTISLSADEQTIDFNGNLQMDYCSGDGKNLYFIYFPDEDAVSVGEAVDPDAPEEEDPEDPVEPQPETITVDVLDPIEFNTMDIDAIAQGTEDNDLTADMKFKYQGTDITAFCTVQPGTLAGYDKDDTDPSGQDITVDVVVQGVDGLKTYTSGGASVTASAHITVV